MVVPMVQVRSAHAVAAAATTIANTCLAFTTVPPPVCCSNINLDEVGYDGFFEATQDSIEMRQKTLIRAVTWIGNVARFHENIEATRYITAEREGRYAEKRIFKPKFDVCTLRGATTESAYFIASASPFSFLIRKTFAFSTSYLAVYSLKRVE